VLWDTASCRRAAPLSQHTRSLDCVGEGSQVKFDIRRSGNKKAAVDLSLGHRAQEHRSTALHAAEWASDQVGHPSFQRPSLVW
jgi:hypothetical protein